MVDYAFLKVLFFCDSGVGKQIFIKKYCSGSFGENYKSTIGVDFFTTKIKLRQGDTASLTFWDIAEQSYFNRIMTLYYKDANAGIIMYDITDGNSLNKILEWIQKIREYSGDIPMLLVGNKSDLQELREVSKEKVEKLKESYDLSSSIEISLKTGENVEQMFMKLAELILNNKSFPRRSNVIHQSGISPPDRYESRRNNVTSSFNNLGDATSPFRGIGHATFKIVIFGDSEVAKADLTKKFLHDLFVSDSRMTIGVEFKTKRVVVGDNEVLLEIWDFGGEERFRFLLPTYVRGAKGGLFMYDITNYASIAHIDDWLSIIRKEIKKGDKFPIIAVGIRSGLGKNRQVSAEEGMKIAKSRGLDGYIECSVETGENVEEVFEELTRLMINRAFI